MAKGPRWARNPKVLARIELAKRRIRSVLGRHTAASGRTLEQKIADAGPTNQRIEPVYLTVARRALEKDGVVSRMARGGLPWYFLSTANASSVDARIAEQLVVHEAVSNIHVNKRVGQALEIAIIRAMRREKYKYFGDFRDLDSHDDSSPYSRIEPPIAIGGRFTDGPVDFIAEVANDWVAIEAKNVRPWIYPTQRDELMPLLRRAVELDVVPVLIARRIPYVTFSEVFRPCGVLMHQTYNQLYPFSAADLAKLAAQKDLLGYHDIRVGNDPDKRLSDFFGKNLPMLVKDARRRFDEHKDLLLMLALGELNYLSFHVELRKRLGIYVDGNYEADDSGLEGPEYDEYLDDDE